MDECKTVDELLKKYGGDPGRYQVFVLAILWFSMCGLALNNMMNLFIITTYPHHCKIPHGWTKNDSLPRTSSGYYDSCHIFINASDHDAGIKPCDNGWQFHPPDGEWSIVQEWDLVCDKHYHAAFATSVYFAGVTFGCAVFGYLADRIGRKPIMTFALTSHIIFAIITGFSVNFGMYASLRFVDGFVLQGAFGSSYVLCVELFQPRRRTFVSVIAQTLWPIMLCLLALLFYLLKSWRSLQFAVNVPFVLSLAFLWFIPESTRWLLAVQKVSRAKVEIKRLARFNKLPLPSNFGDDVDNVVAESKKNRKRIERRYGFLDLFRRKNMKIISCLSFYFHFVAIFAFYGISFAMAGLKVDLYISFCVTALAELAVVIAMYFVLQKVGRRTMSWVCMSLCAVDCLTVVVLLLVLPQTASSQLAIAVTAAIGRAALSGYFSAMPIFSSELSPTVLRNLLCGIANFWGRIGGIVAPQVMLLEIYVWKPLPFLLCAIMSLVAAILTFLLPETKNKALPDIPEDVDRLWEKKSQVHQRKRHLTGKDGLKVDSTPLTQNSQQELQKVSF